MSNKTGLLCAGRQHVGKTILENLRDLGYAGVSEIMICRVRDGVGPGKSATPNYTVRASDLPIMIAFQFANHRDEKTRIKSGFSAAEMPVVIGDEHDQEINFDRVVRGIRVGKGQRLPLFNIVDDHTINGIELPALSHNYGIERVANPIDPDGEDWLKIKGAKIGDTVTSFLRKCHFYKIEIFE